jgi:hypothetical protein
MNQLRIPTYILEARIDANENNVENACMHENAEHKRFFVFMLCSYIYYSYYMLYYIYICYLYVILYNIYIHSYNLL